MKNLLLNASLVLATMSASYVSAAEVVVYSARNEQLIKPLFDAYKAETGVEVKFITDKEGPLLARLQSEGANTSADILLTVDAGNLWQAANLGLLQPVKSATLQKNVPSHLRDPKQQWFGLSVRARTMFYNPNKIDVKTLSSYEDLANATFKDKLCLRSSKKVYNQSLVAMLMATHGEAKTEQIVKGWVSNLPIVPFADDTKLLEAIADPQAPCAVGIANTYYFGRFVEKQPTASVKIFWPNQQKVKGQLDGVHVNVAGAGVTKHAKNKAEAIKLLEWLSSAKAQNLFADSNLEYPVNPTIKTDATVAAWGTFKQSVINVDKAGQLQAKATMLMDRAGYR